MIEAALSIIFSTLIIITFRLMSKYNVDELEAIVFNYFFASSWGLVMWRQAPTPADFIEKPWFLLSLVIGVLFIITFFLLSRSASTAGLAITAVASRMSVLLPVIAGFLLYGDALTIPKVIGIILAIGAFFLIFKPEGQVALNVKRIVLPTMLFLGIGTNDIIMKYIEHHYLVGDESLMLTAVFLISFIIGIIVLLVRNIKKQQQLSFKSLYTGFLLGSLNFGATYFFIRSMMKIESTLLFPGVNVGIVVLSSLTGLVFFRERLTAVNWIGIFTAIMAIVIISSG
jgi:drug/metabolite transporter (DMT)-like permease